MNTYKINEEIARIAKEMNSFSDYKENSATNEYNGYLTRFENRVNELISQYPQNINNEALELIEYYKDKYSKKLAFAINKHNEIETRMPSVMISGPANFNVRKKEKQNNARDNFWKEYGNLFDEDNYYFNKIRTLITNSVIYSNDAMVIEKLENKIADLKELQSLMKQVNAYYRKNKTIDNCELLSDDEIRKLKHNMEIVTWYDAPYPTYELTNNLANIKRLEERLENIKRLKQNAENGNNDKYIKVDGIEVTEDATDMRIRLTFDNIPNEEIRNLLKHNGFKWSPKNKAWQRQLTNNGVYATKKVLETLKEKI